MNAYRHSQFGKVIVVAIGTVIAVVIASAAIPLAVLPASAWVVEIATIALLGSIVVFPKLRTAASSSTFLAPLFTENWRMTDDEKYFFDLNGYLVLRDVVDPDTIRRCNEAIDHYDDQIEIHERRFEGESKALTSDIRQRWSDEMVAWKRPYCEPFRQLTVHPRLKPYLREIIGDYHMATRPRLIVMDQGCAGHYLHGGQLDRLSYSLTYHWKFGKIYNSLTLVEFPLADEGPGDGGLAVVPGGHKANYPIPEALRDCENFQDEVVEVNVRTGDAVIFAETTIHGTLVWRADHQRRTLLYSYCPRYQTLTPPISEVSYPPYVQDMTPEQQALLRPPH